MKHNKKLILQLCLSILENTRSKGLAETYKKYLTSKYHTYTDFDLNIYMQLYENIEQDTIKFLNDYLKRCSYMADGSEKEQFLYGLIVEDCKFYQSMIKEIVENRS